VFAGEAIIPCWWGSVRACLDSPCSLQISLTSCCSWRTRESMCGVAWKIQSGYRLHIYIRLKAVLEKDWWQGLPLAGTNEVALLLMETS
jgi:hypothetical protein